MWNGLGLTNALEIAGGTAIVLAGVTPWIARPSSPLARAFAVLALAVGVTGILASLAESASPIGALAGAMMPYYVFGTLGAGFWLAAVALELSSATGRAIGLASLSFVGALSVIYAMSHERWRDASGLGPLYLALGGRYLLHAVLALVLVVVWRRDPGRASWPLALGFLFYATHETSRWLARATIFPWGETTVWADASFALRLAAIVPLSLAVGSVWQRWHAFWPLLFPIATTLIMRATVSEGVFSSSDIEVAEVELWRTTAYVIAGFGIWRLAR